MRAFLLVVNPRAGTAHREILTAVETELARVGRVRRAMPRTRAELAAVLHRRAADTVVVAGGDGTLHAVVATLWQAGRVDTPVGLVPLGTGNDFARGVGLPLDAVAAAKRVTRGVVRRVDVIVEDTDQPVVNAAHAGVGAQAARLASPLKPLLGQLAYPVGALIAGASVPGWPMRVEVDGATVADGPVLLLGVANGPTIGGGTRLCPGAVVDDGELDVVVMPARGRVDRVRLGLALRAGRHLQHPGVVHARGRTVRVAGAPTRWNTDGEVGQPDRCRSYRLSPGGLSLVQ